MATRSYIGKVQEDGTIKALYCHYDGHPDTLGLNLLNYFGNYEKANQLIDEKKDLRGIYGPFHTLDELDDGDPARNFNSFGSYFDTAMNWLCEYVYLFQNGSWACFGTDGELIDLYNLQPENF